jgi:hypothetical protein
MIQIKSNLIQRNTCTETKLVKKKIAPNQVNYFYKIKFAPRQTFQELLLRPALDHVFFQCRVA